MLLRHKTNGHDSSTDFNCISLMGVLRHTERAQIVPCQHIAFAQFLDALLCCSSAHPMIFDVAWVLLVPVHDAANVGLDHTDASLRCSLSLDKAAMQNKPYFDYMWKTLLACNLRAMTQNKVSNG